MPPTLPGLLNVFVIIVVQAWVPKIGDRRIGTYRAPNENPAACGGIIILTVLVWCLVYCCSSGGCLAVGGCRLLYDNIQDTFSALVKFGEQRFDRL